jgi:hypothetical protein
MQCSGNLVLEATSHKYGEPLASTQTKAPKQYLESLHNTHSWLPCQLLLAGTLNLAKFMIYNNYNSQILSMALHQNENELTTFSQNHNRKASFGPSPCFMFF